MSQRFLTDINLHGFALIAALMDPVSSDPTGLGTGQAGRMWFNSTTGKLMYWNGTTAIDVLARTNHTGTQLASTISDLAATVQAYRLDQFAAPNTDVSLASHKLTNVVDPAGAQDAATKNYVDSQLSGLTSGQVLKGSVRVAPTTNVSLTTPGATIDGVTMASGDVVLLTGQTTASQNGPYVWTGASTALTRATNWDTSAEAVLGSYWIVREGTNADTFALLTNDTAITLGTTAPAFVFRGAAGATYSAGNGLGLAGTTFSVTPVAGGGVLVSGSGVSVDTTLVARKVTGIIPTATTGIYTVSGASVTVNHGLGTSYPDVMVQAGSAPVAVNGYTPAQGEPVAVSWRASDANNVVLTFPAAPAANAYTVAIQG